MSQKNDKDRDFIAKVVSASLEELIKIQNNHQHKSVPEWKKICIERAIKKNTG